MFLILLYTFYNLLKFPILGTKNGLNEGRKFIYTTITVTIDIDNLVGMVI